MPMFRTHSLALSFRRTQFFSFSTLKILVKNTLGERGV